MCTGSFLWDNPRIVGTPYQDDDGQTSYEGPQIGYAYYSNLEEIKYLSFLKGASAVFTFRFEGIDSPLQNHTIQLETAESPPVPDLRFAAPAHTNNCRAYRSHTSHQWKCSSMSQGGTGAGGKSANTRHWGPVFPVGHLCYCLIMFTS